MSHFHPEVCAAPCANPYQCLLGCLCLESFMCTGPATLGPRGVLAKAKGLKDRGFENPLNVALTLCDLFMGSKLMVPYTACLHVQFRTELQSVLDNPTKSKEERTKKDHMIPQ